MYRVCPRGFPPVTGGSRMCYSRADLYCFYMELLYAFLTGKTKGVLIAPIMHVFLSRQFWPKTIFGNFLNALSLTKNSKKSRAISIPFGTLRQCTCQAFRSKSEKNGLTYVPVAFNTRFAGCGRPSIACGATATTFISYHTLQTAVVVVIHRAQPRPTKSHLSCLPDEIVVPKSCQPRPDKRRSGLP